MPRCFLSAKLKYPYVLWKEGQQASGCPDMAAKIEVASSVHPATEEDAASKALSNQAGGDMSHEDGLQTDDGLADDLSEARIKDEISSLHEDADYCHMVPEPQQEEEEEADFSESMSVSGRSDRSCYERRQREASEVAASADWARCDPTEDDQRNESQIGNGRNSAEPAHGTVESITSQSREASPHRDKDSGGQRGHAHQKVLDSTGWMASADAKDEISGGNDNPTPSDNSSRRQTHKLFRPYCLDDPIDRKLQLPRYLASAAASTWWTPPELSQPPLRHEAAPSGEVNPSAASLVTPLDLTCKTLAQTLDIKVEPEYPNPGAVFKINGGRTTAYTYEAFFASDGRSKKKLVGVEKPKYRCNECGKNYATSSNLSRHKQTHKTLDPENAKKCHVCGKMYVSVPALSMHVLTHSLNHKCDICGKAFSRPWLLQGHKRSHTGDKPYGCAHCGKCFADRSNLRAHMQTHSAYKHYKCKLCQKSFALKSYLNKHYESACYKDQQPPPSIDTPPQSPPAPSIGMGGGGGLPSPTASVASSASSISPPVLPGHAVAPCDYAVPAISSFPPYSTFNVSHLMKIPYY